MLGGESLADKPTAQIVICESAPVYELVRDKLPDQAVVLWEPDDELEVFDQFAGRDVIVFGELTPLLVHRVKPAKLRTTANPVPADFSVRWIRDNIGPYPPENKNLRLVQPYNESAAQAPGQPWLPSGATSAGSVEPEPDAADPIEAVRGDLSQPLPEVPDYLESGPDSDLATSRPINGESHVWVKPEAEEWPLPIDPFTAAKPPPEFDTSVFTGDLKFLGTYAADIAELKGVDAGIPALSILTALSAWVAEPWRVQVKAVDISWQEAGRLWCCILGPSACGKTVGMDIATKPARDLDKLAAKEGAHLYAKYKSDCRVRELQVADYEKRAAQNKLNPGEEMPKPVDPPELDFRLYGDANKEGLRSRLELCNKSWLYTSELAQWLSSFGRYAATGKDAAAGDRAFFLQAWDGGEPPPDLRQSREIHMKSLSTVILGGITPSSLRSSLGSATLHEDGLAQRLIVYNARLQVEDTDALQDADTLEKVTRTLHNLRAMRPDNDAPLKLAADAYQYFRQFINEIQTQADNGMYSSACSSGILKFRSHAVRLALILHLTMRAANNQECARGETIPLETLKMACDICRQLIDHTIYFWSGVLDDTRAFSGEVLQICELIACFHMERTFGVAKIASTYRKWWPQKTVAQKAQLLTCLADMNWIRNNPSAGLQSPGVYTSYLLHPALFKMFNDHQHIIAARIRRRAVVNNFAQQPSENPAAS